MTMAAVGYGTRMCGTCQPRPRAASSAGRRRTVGAEERAQLLRVQLRLSNGAKCSPRAGLGHAYDVRRALQARPRRADDVAGDGEKPDGT